MTKSTSILLGDYFEESKKNELIKELKKGEDSGFIEDFNNKKFLSSMHSKYISLKN